MKFIKTIEVLDTKARNKGEAKVNGRMSYGWGNLGELEEKYKVINTGSRVELYHWGTRTLVLENGEVVEFYGESNSDRDSINTMLYLHNINSKARYRPSIDLFELV